MRGVGSSFTGGLLCSELFVSGEFTIDLDTRATSAANFSMVELASCKVAVSGFQDCMHPAEISVTFLSKPQQMTTLESICTSMLYRPYGNDIIASWTGRWYHLPMHLLLRLLCHHARQNIHGHVVVIPCPSSTIAGRITKNCHNSTDFENPAPREICPGLLNSIEVFLSLERCPVTGRTFKQI